MHKILLVDDDASILKSLHRLLRTLDIDIYTANNPNDALSLCEDHQFKLVLSDQRMPYMDGTELLSKIKESQPDATRIILSAYSDFDAITNAFNDGILHKFISKPWNNDDLRYVVQSVISEESHAVEDNLVTNHNLVDFHGIYTQCDEMLNVFDIIKRVSTANVPINIYGPTGTGKELVAQAIHKQSSRHEKKLLAINCANLTTELAESQLFGHKKGAFTGATNHSEGLLAAANGGTLFLDEVTCLPSTVQVKLLRALQEQEYYIVGSTEAVPFDVQVISASSTSLHKAVESGEFRADLRFRLEVIPLTIPPLKDRGIDSIELYKLFIQQLRKSQPVSIDKEVEQKILTYSWPGNVRELYNAASYSHAMCEGETIHLDHLPGNITSSASNSYFEPPQTDNSTTLEEPQITKALEQYKGNRSKAAESLGISRMTLWRKMKQLNL